MIPNGSKATILTLLLSYFFAIYLRFSKSRISNIIGILYLLPRFIPSLVAVYAIKLVISDSGFLNRLSLLLPESNALYNIKPGILYNKNGIILVNIWFNIPFSTMIISASLSNIPNSIIESARDVGAKPFHVFYKMILPLSIRDTMIAATFLFMSNISAFTISYIIGPNYPLMMGVFLRQEFSNHNYERAAALSVIIFLFSFVSAFVYLYTNLKDKGWEQDVF